jgi:hypothetical protein
LILFVKFRSCPPWFYMFRQEFYMFGGVGALFRRQLAIVSSGSRLLVKAWGTRMVFLLQHPHIPPGTLRHALL